MSSSSHHGVGDGDEPIDPEDVWLVISAYFKEQQGLVRQQLNSFDDFLDTSLSEIVAETPPIVLTPSTEHNAFHSDNDEQTRVKIKYSQVWIQPPTIREAQSERTTEKRKIPYLLPNEARLRNLTYSSHLLIDVEQETHEWSVATKSWVIKDTKIFEKSYLGKIPIMLRSGHCTTNSREVTHDELSECFLDQGGYFIINGSEKVLLAHERMASNHVSVFKKSGAATGKFSIVAEVRSQPTSSRSEGDVRGRNQPPLPFYLKMTQRKSKEPVKSASSGEARIEPGEILCEIPYVKNDIPLGVVFRALGMLGDQEILQYACYNLQDQEMTEMLIPSFKSSYPIQDAVQALGFIGTRATEPGVKPVERRAKASDILLKYMLPHVGMSEYSGRKKAFFIGYMTHKMLSCALGRRKEDDRDHYGNKRLDMAGPLFANLFRQLFRKLHKYTKKFLQLKLNNGAQAAQGGLEVVQAINPDIVSKGLKYSLATGNWGDPRGGAANVKTGVAQVLMRLTFAASLSHLRRVNSPIGRDGKMAKPRQLHNTHWGMVCPAETPEGQSCGLVKNLALMAYITVGSEEEEVRDLFSKLSVTDLDELHVGDLAAHGWVKVFLNGNWLGINSAPVTLIKRLREARHSDLLCPEVSIVRDVREREVRVYTDAGRCCRPLFVVDNLRPRIRAWHIAELDTKPWKWLLEKGLIEYLDTNEEESAMIAMNMKDLEKAQLQIRHNQETYSYTYTHMEIHPSMILGICASIIPFPDHNQSPRNTYQSAMGKQAMGVYASNFHLRMDTMAHVLFYPQKPLVTTKAMEYLSFKQLPAGQNAVVAIACYSGYNQEDSVIMNQSSIDRGLFRSVFYRTYRETEMRPGAFDSECIERPDPQTTRIKFGEYGKLDDDGLVAPGTTVVGDDIIIGKTTPITNPEDEPHFLGLVNTHTKKDSSVKVRSAEQGYIDQVMISTNEENFKFVKVRIRAVRIPQIGDKFSSRHGQKGTIGMTYRTEDMPFTRDGISPDIIVNPHAIPSRMTIGQLIECLLGKVSSLNGTEGNGTPFPVAENIVDEISAQLHELRYQKRGNEIMYNGHTGRRLAVPIFVGPTYYQRLKHMVDDKVHSRARGPVALLTRQPVEGRSRDGGLRFGEMERDCMISHGAAAFLKERLFDQSDAYRCHVCDFCGLIAIAKLKTGTGSFECKGCQNSTQISQITIPYACKLLFQELMAMTIAPRMF